jgi:hypothetical protein
MGEIGRDSADVDSVPASNRIPFPYRGTSPKRKRTPLEPYRRHMPRVLGGS